MIKIGFEVLGKKWTMRLLKRKKFNRRHGADCVAITCINKRRIDLSQDGQDLETITHELVHAYLGELCTGSTDLDDDNLEEIFAEMIAKRGRELIELGEYLRLRVEEETAECPMT